MSYLLFLDESGIDGNSPYEVLAGICIEDSVLWNFVQRAHEGEEAFFSCRLSLGHREIKGSKLLEKKSFEFSKDFPEYNAFERQKLVREFFTENERARSAKEQPRVRKDHFAAYGQARLAYTHYLLDLCNDFHAKAFASIVAKDAPRPEGKDYLRKDYAYLFERYYYFLESMGKNTQGFVVFDELEKTQSHLLVDQMERYFTRTEKGRFRSNRIIPEPFFVHSHLTTMIQVADIIAYIINKGIRIAGMDAPQRLELEPFAQKVLNLRFKTNIQDQGGNPQTVWGFKYMDDLGGQRSA